MNENARRPAAEVRPIAQRLANLLRPHCHAVVIAGSLRRDKPDVGDVDMVVSAKPTLLDFMDGLVADGVLTKARYGAAARWGPLYRGVIFEGVKCEIAIPKSEGYGAILLIKTGSHAANKFLMSHLIASHAPYRFRDGYFWHGTNWRRIKAKWVGDHEQQIPVPDEPTLYRLLGLPFVEPAERTEEVYRKLLTAPAHTWGTPPEVAPQMVQTALWAAATFLRFEQEGHAKLDSGIETAAPSTVFEWERPWLRGARVIVWHEGRWVLVDPFHPAAETYRARLGRMSWLLREAEAADLQRWLLVQWATAQELAVEVVDIISDVVAMLRTERMYA